jgi:peptide/nickel transport system ATP-binding protein
MSDSPQPPVLEVRNLVVRYGKKLAPAVDDVSFTIARGETLGLIGESGSGKTTIGRAILGLLPVASGQILFDGRDISQATPAQRRALRGDLRAVFQDPYSSLDPRSPIGVTIAEPLRVGGWGRAEREARVRDVLESVGLPGTSGDRYPREFSGGQRQRIAIARALVTDPRLVVCDEAVSALDLSTQAQVLNLLADLRSGADLGYLFIAHDMAVVEFLAQRVVVLYRGRVVEEGMTADVIQNPREPYTRALMAASPVPDPDEQARRREAWRLLREQAKAATP